MFDIEADSEFSWVDGDGGVGMSKRLLTEGVAKEVGCGVMLGVGVGSRIVGWTGMVTLGRGISYWRSLITMGLGAGARGVRASTVNLYQIKPRNSTDKIRKGKLSNPKGGSPPRLD